MQYFVVDVAIFTSLHVISKTSENKLQGSFDILNLHNHFTLFLST